MKKTITQKIKKISLGLIFSLLFLLSGTFSVSAQELSCFSLNDGNKTVQTNMGQCYHTVADASFDIVVGEDFSCISEFNDWTFTYTLDGATTGSGTTTLIGKNLNKGYTGVLWSAVYNLNTAITYTFTKFTVKVDDIERPVVYCPANITAFTDAGMSTATVVYPIATATDNCEVQSIFVSSGPASGASFPIGTTQLTYTATDATGNSGTCTFSITVIDNIAPVLTLPANISTNTNITDGRIISYSAPTASDNSGTPVAVELVKGPANNSLFPPGETYVVFKATDIYGNYVIDSFKVEVIDNIPPVINCPENVIVNNKPNECVATVDYIVTANDNCPSFMNFFKTEGFLPGTDIPVGTTTTVTWVAADVNNTTTCTFTVTAVDVEKPIIISPPSDINTSKDANTCSKAVTFDLPTVVDNCSAPINITYTQTAGLTSGSLFPIGTTTNTFQYTDQAGNTQAFSFNVNVADPSPANMTPPADVTITLPLGETTATNVNLGLPDITGNCQVLQVTNSASPDPNNHGQNQFTEGITVVTWTLITPTDTIEVTQNVRVILTVNTCCDAFAVNINEEVPYSFCATSASTLTAAIDTGSCTQNTAYTYLWSTGATTPSIIAATAGTYSVTVTNASSCVTSNSITVTATVPENSGTNYVILARQHVQLFRSTVYSGGVGISNFKYDCGYNKEGKLWVKHFSNITAPGTFIEGTDVSVDASSQVTTINNKATDATFPEFEHMPYESTNDAAIPNNTTVYLTDTLYNAITVGTNATVIFTQPVVNIDKFIKMTNGSTMKFAQCAKVRLNHFIDAGQNVTINPDEKYVTFFIKGNANFQKGATVNGIFVMEDFHVYDNDDYDDSDNYGGWGNWNHFHGQCSNHNVIDDNHTTCGDHKTTYSHNVKCGTPNPNCGNHGNDYQTYYNNNDNDWQDINDNNTNCDIRKNHHLHTNNATASKPNVFKGMFYVGSLHSGQYTKWYKADFCGNCAPYTPVAWTCPDDITLCDGQEKFRLRSQYPATIPGISSLTNDQPTTFPIGTTVVHWTVQYTNGAYSYCTQNVTRSGPISVVINRDGLFCENSFRLRAVATGTGPFTYEWNTGETTPNIIADANGGDYNVVVSNSLGCDSSYHAVVSVDPTDLMPEYTMYALSSIRLNQTNVISGSMGVNSTTGTCDATYTSHCDHTASWTKCKKIYKDNTSTIYSQVKNYANVVLPVFESNVYTSCNNVTVAANATTTLTDTVYNTITLNTNSTVIFTRDVVNIRTLNLGQGSTVQFTVDCGKVRIKNAIAASKLVNINPDKKSMLFYCENNVTFQEGAHVYGIFYLTYGGKINYTFSLADYYNQRFNDFEGMVIAKDIYSGKKTTWALNNFCQGCLVIRDQQTTNSESAIDVQDILLSNYPNPFTKTTSIAFTLPEDNHVTINVFDVSGKRVATLFNENAAKNKEYKVEFDGTELPAGIYIYKLATDTQVLTGKMTMFR